MRTYSRAAVAAGALAATAALLAGCAAESSGILPAAGTPAVTTSPASASPAPAPGSVFGRVLNNPTVTVTGGRLYVTWQLNPVSATVPRIVLARVDQATGAVEATHRLVPGSVGAPLAAGGWLWVPVLTAAGESLFRMSPVSLTVTGEVGVWSDSGIGLADHLAVAGGALWVAGGERLVRVSLPDGRVTAAIPLPGSYTSDVGASADGSVLVVSVADSSGLGSLERRDPVTGALLASHSIVGVAAPEVGGVIGAGVWVAEPTGMLGYVERFALATMTPDPATDVHGTNGIRVRVADEVVWVTDMVAGAGRNYCADPDTGRVLARIAWPDLDQDFVLAISGRYIYYVRWAGHGSALQAATVPSSCLR